MTRYQDTPVDKEGSILQLASTGGHSEIPVGNHQRGSPIRGSPMIESSSLGSHTEMSKPETGVQSGETDEMRCRKVLQSSRSGGFTFTSLSEQGKLDRRA